jgi:hypothetical protein
MPVDMTYISGDSGAADALETAYDGTAGPVPSQFITDQGTAQAVGASSLTLRAGFSATDNDIIGQTLWIPTATNGIYQSAVVSAWNNTTKVATVSPAWNTTITGTIGYKLGASPRPDSVAQTADHTANIATILTDTADTLDTVDAIATLLAVVDAEVLAVKAVTDLLIAAHAEPTGVPTANPTPLTKLGFLYAALRNKLTINKDTGEKKFFNDAGSAQWKKTLTDDDTTYTENEGTTP